MRDISWFGARVMLLGVLLIWVAAATGAETPSGLPADYRGKPFTDAVHRAGPTLKSKIRWERW